MRYCLRCQTEWRDQPHTCPECSGRTISPATLELVREIEHDQEQIPFVDVDRLSGPVEGSMVKRVFEVEGVPFFIKETAGDNLGVALQDQRGWGTLQVPATYHEEATELLGDIRDAGAAAAASLEE